MFLFTTILVHPFFGSATRKRCPRRSAHALMSGAAAGSVAKTSNVSPMLDLPDVLVHFKHRNGAGKASCVQDP